MYTYTFAIIMGLRITVLPRHITTHAHTTNGDREISNSRCTLILIRRKPSRLFDEVFVCGMRQPKITACWPATSSATTRVLCVRLCVRLGAQEVRATVIARGLNKVFGRIAHNN